MTERLLAEINAHLSERGLLLSKGTIVDATIIDAPSSTKNSKKKRDPQMHQTRKSKQWYFGMKVHIGVDTDSGLVHTSLSDTASRCARAAVGGGREGRSADVVGAGKPSSEDRAFQRG